MQVPELEVNTYTVYRRMMAAHELACLAQVSAHRSLSEKRTRGEQLPKGGLALDRLDNYISVLRRRIDFLGESYEQTIHISAKDWDLYCTPAYRPKD